MVAEYIGQLCQNNRPVSSIHHRPRERVKGLRLKSGRVWPKVCHQNPTLND